MSDEQTRPGPFDEGGPDVEDQIHPRPVITLLTDFGLESHYVPVMKGVILGVNPDVQIVDLGHSVEPYDIQGGAVFLAAAYHYFPKGTIHVGVVDPGVGGERRGILMRTRDYYFVGPDNGLFTFVLDDPAHLWSRELRTVEYFLEKVSSTFHGRDVFAPVAGYLSLGEEPDRFGPLVDDPLRLEGVRAGVDEKGDILGEVISVDRFGNLITNIDTVAFWEGETRAEELRAEFVPVIEICGATIHGMTEFYQAAPAERLGAHFNSWSRLEIFLREGSASERLGAGRGTPVKVHFEADA
ncbi:MAG: SAM-dependent chlorinase/fluorinase [bacterium]